MSPDDAKARIRQDALDELGTLFKVFFNANDGNVPNAAGHFEQGLKVLLKTEAQALEIVTKILEGGA